MPIKLFLLALLALPRTALAADPCVLKHIPHAVEVGRGRMSVMVSDIYDATLYAPGGDWSFDKPFALRLDYLRKIHGMKIAERSIEEMRHIGLSNGVKMDQWRVQMEKIFPDVGKGDSLTGLYTPGAATVFCQKGRKIGKVNDADFGRAFFGIWLDKKTRSPHLRRKLLDGKG